MLEVRRHPQGGVTGSEPTSARCTALSMGFRPSTGRLWSRFLRRPICDMGHSQIFGTRVDGGSRLRRSMCQARQPSQPRRSRRQGRGQPNPPRRTRSPQTCFQSCTRLRRRAPRRVGPSPRSPKRGAFARRVAGTAWANSVKREPHRWRRQIASSHARPLPASGKGNDRGNFPANDEVRLNNQYLLAVTEGFEPSVRLYTVQRFSKPPPSATRPRHQQGMGR